MTAYRDSADWLRNGVQSGHLISDDLEELHALAEKLGLAERYWMGDCLTPHYQLPERLQSEADALGVIYLERAAFTARVRQVNARLEARTRGEGRSPSSNRRKPEAPLRHATTTPLQQELL